MSDQQQLTVDQLQAENERLRAKIDDYRKSIELWAEAEAEWTRKKRLFRIMTENVADLIAIIDRQGHRIWNNPAYGRILGYSQADLEGSYSMAEVHPDDQAKVMNAFYETLSSGKGRRIEYRMQHKNGDWVFLESESAPVLDTEGQVECIVLMARDITKRRDADREMIKLQKLESAATLAGSVAKEFNDIVTSLLGNIAVAKKLNGGGYNALGARLNEIEQAAERARDVTDRLMSFAPGEKDAPKKVIDPREIIGDAAKRGTAGTLARSQVHFPSNLWKVRADPIGLSRALKNIINNAALSMTGGGVVQIIGENATFNAASERNRGNLPPGRYVHLIVRDQGAGMSERALAKAFEPYFTTRERAKGLGLTTALNDVQNYGGTILLESTLGVGTEAGIYVPAAEVSTPSTTLAPTVSSNSSLSSKPTVLLMDDEPMILELVAGMLQHLGYEVKTTTDGAQAIAAYTKSRSGGRPYDLVLMDLMVPQGVGGVDAVLTLRKINAGVRVIACSGHTDHEAMAHPEKFGFCAVLHKPYRLDKLEHVLESALSKTPPPLPV